MGKFGKKNEISLNPLDYQILLAGQGGIGKTSIAKEICEKLVGEDGYIHFNIGREQGVDAISNIISEPIEDWVKLEEVVEDIIENKTNDYPNLKVIVWDSLDELIHLGETETIRQYNKKNPEKKADTILQAWGGFGKGNDYCINLILDKMWELKKVGVNSFIIAHVKKADIIDPVTQETYSQLTADTQQRYFNAVRNKMDIIAMGYMDREIIKEKTGRKNVVTHKDIEINKIASEARVISFRDEGFSIDSKSRFADIVDKIPFNADEFIKAIKDAILAEQKKSGTSLKDAEKKQKAKDKEAEEAAKEYSKSAKENKIDPDRNAELIEYMTGAFKELDDDKKTPIKELMKAEGLKNFNGLSEYPTAKVEEIKALFD